MDLKTLQEAVVKCGELLIKLQKKGVTTKAKNMPRGQHFLTEADEASQGLGIDIIHQRFPDEVIVAEEQEHAGKVPENCTVFDPLDGTTLYFNGGEDWGVTFCVFRKSKPVAGIIHCPRRNIMLTCEAGKGVLLNGKKLPVLHWDRPFDKTLIGMEPGPWTDPKMLNGLMSEFLIRGNMVAVYDAYEILIGRTGAYINCNISSIWDFAAGSLMIQELGGLTLNPWGKPLKWNTIAMDIVWAANQELADAVLQHTKQWPGRG